MTLLDLGIDRLFSEPAFDRRADDHRNTNAYVSARYGF